MAGKSTSEGGLPRRVVVVGGGISGLATAWELRRTARDLKVALLEANQRPGGKAWTHRERGYLLETGPNGFLDNKPSTLALCESLEISDQLLRTEVTAANRFVFLGDRLRRLPASPGEFLASDILSWRGKLRTLAERLIPAKKGDQDESVRDFGYRRFGKEATDVLLDAVVTGIHAGDYEKLSLPACFPLLAEWEKTHGSLIRAQGQLAKQRRKAREKTSAPLPRGSSLVAPRGGMRTLSESLAAKMADSVRLGVEVTKIERRAEGWLVRASSDQWPADALVLACPAHAQADLLQSVDENLANEVGGIPYTSAIVVSLGYAVADLPKYPNGFGYLAPQHLHRPVLGVQWSSSILPGQAPNDCFQFRAILGGWRRRDVLSWDDETLIQLAREDLRVTMNISAEPKFTWLHRWEKAIPQYHLGHHDRLQRIEQRLTNHPGLFLTGNAYQGIAINDCTLRGQQIALKVAEYARACDASKIPHSS